MIDKNDLYDMTCALIIIRNNISKKSNIQVLYKMIGVLETKNNNDDNQIRKAISSINDLECEHWFFVYHNNFYVNHQNLHNDGICSLLTKLLNELVYELNKGRFDKAYDLIDSFHCLPQIIADNNFTIPKTFWKTFIDDYRNKWDKNFLKAEQKQLKNIRHLKH